MDNAVILHFKFDSYKIWTLVAVQSIQIQQSENNTVH